MLPPVVSEAVLDTSLLVDILDGKQPAIDRLKNLRAAYLPIFAVAEIYFMAENSQNRDVNYARVASLCDQFQLLNITLDVARVYAEVRKEVLKTHPRMPAHDLWIAASARHLNLPVVSNDKHFAAIPHLVVLTW
jgi:predicted nucleic acid-binding protein